MQEFCQAAFPWIVIGLAAAVGCAGFIPKKK